MENKQDFIDSYYSIRKLIGILGMALPFAIYFGFGELLASISHYYYASSAVFFIAILSAFGLLLISYRGYKRNPDTEWLSDNLITHIGGFAALLVVLIPTSCLGSGNGVIDAYCGSSNFPLYGHCNKHLATVHLLSAGLFFFTMGYMSIFRFTKGYDCLEKRRKNRIYRTCGIIMWSSIGLLLVEKVLSFIISFPFYTTFLFETVAILAFGISWLVKGEAIKDIVELTQRVRGHT